MKTTLLIVTLFLLYGCTVKTEIIKPNGDIYIIKSKADALVVMKSGDEEFTIDNRGQPNIFQSFLSWILVETNPTDVIN